MSLLKNQDYYDIKSQIKTTIPNSNFQDEVIVGAEFTNSDNIKEKLVTINVYKQGNNIPHFTLKRSFSSKETSQTNIGNPEWLGSTNGGSITGTAKEAGFIVAAGSSKPYSLNVYVNGKLLGYVVPRGYGTGDIQVCVPVPKGSSWSISGKCSWAYWMSLK